MVSNFVMFISKNNLFQWRIVFILTAIIYIVGGFSLLIFTSGFAQPWATHEKSEDNDEC